MRLIDAEQIRYRYKFYEKANDKMAYVTDRDIAEMPTVEAEPIRHRKWIPCSAPDSNANQLFMCSECQSTDEHAKTATVPYCWHCGAKMDVR